MKVVVAGSRDIVWPFHVKAAIHQSGFQVDEVVSGTARGVDQQGEEWARERGITVMKFPADWNKHGKAAGFMRNAEMAQYADALVAIWDGESRGTAHMIKTMEALGKPVYVYKVRDSN